MQVSPCVQIIIAMILTFIVVCLLTYIVCGTSTTSTLEPYESYNNNTVPIKTVYYPLKESKCAYKDCPGNLRNGFGSIAEVQNLHDYYVDAHAPNLPKHCIDPASTNWNCTDRQIAAGSDFKSSVQSCSKPQSIKHSCYY